YGIQSPADVKATNVQVTANGLAFTVQSYKGEEHFRLQLLGKFNVYNALAAIAVSLVQQVPLQHIRNSLERIKYVEGRMELVSAGQQFLIIVDYAHTPDGLENALATIRDFAEGRIITVFGCGGDRDRTKRPLMGEVAAKYSDYVVV